MHRFFVPPESILADRVVLPSAVARQVSRVLRLRSGDQIMVLDNEGWEYSVTLEDVSHSVAAGTVTSKAHCSGEPKSRITLYQGVLKAGKFELVLQKCTELGVAVFVPVLCTRSIPRTRIDGPSEKRADRWRKIVAEAAEQSGRAHIPIIGDQLDFRDACDAVQGPAVIPWEEEDRQGLRQALADLKDIPPPSLSIFIGPEGGFTTEETDLARARAIEPVTLGSRILRAETAAVAAVSAVLYELGDLGG